MIRLSSKRSYGPALKKILETRGKLVEVRFGCGLESFEQDADGVTAVVRDHETGESESIRAQYLAGCDGAGSVTRQGLGIELDELSFGDVMRGGEDTDPDPDPGSEQPAGAQLFMVHFESKDRAIFERFGRVWHIQSPTGGTIISQNDVDTWTLHGPLPPGTQGDEIDPKAFLFEHLGCEVDCRVVQANAWTPRLILAKSYGKGRVWLAGDSAHQVIPTGGYGMNTGVGDAVDLGWKLTAMLEGWGGPSLLPSYEAERLPIGNRNRAASARHMGIRTDIGRAYNPGIHEDSDRGQKARQALGEHIAELGNLENEALGIEIGYRYDDSPVVCHESGTPPPYEMADYQPSTWPGLRVPSLFLADGSAIHDRLGKGFTLLRFTDVDADRLLQAAAQRGVPLELVDIRDAKAQELYERNLVLVRPDQHVAWRGDRAPEDPLEVMDRVRGAAL